MTMFATDDITNYLLEKTGPGDRATRRIEALAARMKERRLTPMGKAIQTASTTLGTGTTGTEHVMPEDREKFINKEFSEQYLPLFYFLNNVVTPRDVEVLNPEVGIETTDGHSRGQFGFTDELGVNAQSNNWTVEIDYQYLIKIIARQNDASLITEYFKYSFGMERPFEHNRQLIEKLVMPKQIDHSLWHARKDATRLAGTGSNYLGFDGIPELILKLYESGDSAYNHLVLDKKGKKVTSADFAEIARRQVEKGFMGLQIVPQRGAMGGIGAIENTVAIGSVTDFAYIGETEAHNFMNVNNRVDASGFAFNGYVKTPDGDYHFVRDVNLLKNLFLQTTDHYLTNPEPSTCDVVPPAGVVASAVAEGVLDAPDVSYFDSDQHNTHATNPNGHMIWVSFIGPKGISRSIAADQNATGGVTTTAGQLLKIEIDNRGGIDDVFGVVVFRGTSLTNGRGIWRIYPIQSGVATIIYDNDFIMPGMRPLLHLPLDRSVQQLRLMPFTQIKMTTTNQSWAQREALIWAGAPALNNRLRACLQINCGDN